MPGGKFVSRNCKKDSSHPQRAIVEELGGGLEEAQKKNNSKSHLAGLALCQVGIFGNQKKGERVTPLQRWF